MSKQTIVAVGCAAEPAADDDMEAPVSAPDTDEAEGGPSGGTNDDAAGSTRPSAPDTPPASPEPATRPAVKRAAEPAANAAPQPVAKPAVVADGRHAGRLVSITDDVAVELVRVLTGAEAIAATNGDGGAGLDDDGTLPNDVYVQEFGRVVTIPVAGDAGFRSTTAPATARSSVRP